MLLNKEIIQVLLTIFYILPEKVDFLEGGVYPLPPP